MDAYTKAEVNTLLDGKADTATTYTKDELTGSSAVSVAKASSASTAANATSAATAENASTASTALALSASTAATAASGDSVVLKTTGGTYVEIDRDSFAEVMREQLGRLIKGTTDKGTSINGIAAMDASNDLGWVSAANLASVLGAGVIFVTEISSPDVLFSYHDKISAGICKSDDNPDSTKTYFILNIDGIAYNIQFAYHIFEQQPTYHIRTTDSAGRKSSWKQITTT